MAFVKKTWTDRMSQYPTRRVLTDTTSGTTQTVTVTRSEGEVSQTGDAFSADNMNDLENRIQAGINAAHSDADVLLPSTVGWTGKNLLKNTASSKTQNGVTFTVNADKTILVSTDSGGATAQTAFVFDALDSNTLPSGNYIVSQYANADNDYYIYLNAYNNDSFVKVIDNTIGYENKNMTIDYNGYNKVMPGIIVKSGKIITTAITFKPMIRLATITDPTYEPYHKSVEECKTDYSAIATVEDKSTASKAYAIGDYFVKDGKLCKVTQAISSGGALTKNTNYTETLVADELGGGGISGIVPTSLGGTGNADGYIRTGQKANTTVGGQATAEGLRNTASGNQSHAEGVDTMASNTAAHAEGNTTQATGIASHAEGGGGVVASGQSSHAEGASTTASGHYSHAEGQSTKAQANAAHAQNFGTTASANYSSAAGYYTTAGYQNQFVVGKYNNNKSTSMFEVGIGTGSGARANGLELDTSGNLKVAGSVTDGNGHTLGGGGNKVVTIDVPGSSAVTGQYFNVTLSALPSISVGDILVLAIHCNHTFSGSTGAGWGLSITVDSSTTTWGSNLFRNYPEQTSSSSFFTSVFKDSFVPTGKVFTFVCFEMSGTTPQFLMIAEENAQPGEQTVTLSTSSTTTVTFTRDDITTASVVEVGISEWGLVPEDVVCSAGSCTVTLPKVSSAHSVTVRLYVR